MMKKTLLTFTIALAVTLASAQDSLVTISDLSFESPFEEDALKGWFEANQKDPFTLLMANGQLLSPVQIQNSHNAFDNYLSKLDIQRFGTKHDKLVKYVFDELHKSYLKKLENTASFESIFANGSFDSYSSAGLFALAFAKLGIPYQLMRSGNEIYLVAYPDTDKIKVAPTTVTTGFTVNQLFKTAYITQLHEMKIISDKEFKSATTDQLFESYFELGESTIGIVDLAGAFYFQAGLISLNDKKYEAAFNNFQKSNLLTRSRASRFMLLMTCGLVLDEVRPKPDKHARLLAFLSHFDDIASMKDEILSEYVHVLDDHLKPGGEVESLEDYNRKFFPSIRDSVTQAECMFAYHYEKGRYYFNRSMYAKAVAEADEALNLNPNKERAKDLYINAVLSSLTTTSSSEEAIKTIEDCMKKHPTTKSNRHLVEILANAYLKEMLSNYEFLEIGKGEQNKGAFESLMAENTDLHPNADLLGRAYSTAAVYYFRKNQISKSKVILKKGLSYDPDNYELRRRQQMLN